MKNALKRWLLVGTVVVLVSMISGIFRERVSAPNSGVNTESSQILSFVQPAFAQTGGKSFLELEAGISAYANAGQAIDLSKAKPLYKVIEDETAEYLIGTMELPGYGESWWPHVWIDKSGWIVVYYPKTEPTSKFFEWAGFSLEAGPTTTTLRDVLLDILKKLYLPTTIDVRYYHFQYPEATKLFIVVDTARASDGVDYFQYTIPAGMVIYEGCWSFRAYKTTRWSSLKVDNVTLIDPNWRWEGTYTTYGGLRGELLTPNQTHKVEFDTEYHCYTGYFSSDCTPEDAWVGVAILFLCR